MDRNDFDKVFNVKDKELWRKINRNKNRKSLNKSEEIYQFKTVKVGDMKSDHEVKDLNEEIPFISNLSNDIDDNLFANDSFNDDLCKDNFEEDDFCDDEFCGDDDLNHHISNENLFELREDIRRWAIDHQIKHAAINALLKILKNHISENVLPKDARALVNTPRTVSINTTENGQYWHYGLQRALLNALSGRSGVSTLLSLNVNIDGVPMYKSSVEQFWPILVNVTEIPDVAPLTIGIFCGKSNNFSVK